MLEQLDVIRTVLAAIEFQKTKIIQVESDPSLPFLDKSAKLAELRMTLIRTQAAATVLMSEELAKLKKAA